MGSIQQLNSLLCCIVSIVLLPEEEKNGGTADRTRDL